jgi:ParB family chromosome partitioning protein
MTLALPALHHVNGESEIRLVELGRIRVLNPRVRNKKIFARLVENIATLGLKRPITVAERGSDDTGQNYDLICGQGRYEAYQMLGEKEIPCVVVQASEVDHYLISLVENLARRKHSNHDLLDAVRILEDRGYNNAQIAQKTGLDPSYINTIIYLLRQGEERLIGAVERGWLSIPLAADIARSGDAEIQTAMMRAYETGMLKGDQLMRVRRLIMQRNAFGKGYRRGWHRRGEKNVTPQKLVKTYQAEVRRQKLMVKKAEINDQRLLFVTSALRRLMADEHFLTLLRAENIQDMPQPLAERVRGGGHA